MRVIDLGEDIKLGVCSRICRTSAADGDAEGLREYAASVIETHGS